MLSIGSHTYENVAAAVRGLQAIARDEGDRDPNLHRALAEALALADRADEAIEAYRTAMTAGATAADHLRLAEMLMRRQRPLEARAHLVKAAAVDSPDPDWALRVARGFDELADCYFAAGDLPTALECHDVAWRIVPGRVESAVAAALKQHEDNLLRGVLPELRPAAEGGPTLYAALVVWGETHTRQFLELCLPSLLAPGNLPALAAHQRVTLVVFATPESIAALDQAEAFATLRRHAEVIFAELPRALIEQTTRPDFPASVRYRITLQLVSAHHHAAAIMAAVRGAGLLFLVPDWVLSDGCLQAVAAGLQAGTEIFALPILVASRARLARALAPFGREGVLAVPAAELSRLGVATLHESWRQFIARDEGFVARQFPSWMLWPFGESGLVLHAFHWSVLCVSAKRLAGYEGQRFWTLDHRLIDALLRDDGDWRSVRLCRDPSEMTVVAFDTEGKDYAWASETPSEWRLPELVAEATPGTSLLSLSGVNHLLFRQPVVFGDEEDRAAREAALLRARALTDALEAEIATVSIKRV